MHYYEIDWDNQKYYYSPNHHQIFIKPDIPLSHESSSTNPDHIHISSIWLNVSDNCNLRCKYCFIPPTTSDSTRLMSKETARAAVMKLASWWKPNRNCPPPRIMFFGGEPLLNREIVEYTIHFSKEWSRSFGVPFDYRMVTNATLLTDQDIELYKRERILVHVSIDGPESIHDRMRVFNDGSGSHSIAIKNAVELLSRLGENSVAVRATLSSGASDLGDIIQYFASLGFRAIAVKHVEPSIHTQGDFTDADLDHFLKNVDKYVEIITLLRRQGVRVYPFETHIRSFRKRYKPSFTCGAGSCSLVIDSQGLVYPCHRFIGNPQYLLGHIRDELNWEISKEFAVLNTSNIPECSSCWAEKFCLGCCPAESLMAGKPMGHPNPHTCHIKKIYALLSLKCAIAEGIGFASKE
ncbi:MAG: SPASM domain-containing protein [Clostridia bacterium]|nr:SPASM domain-containing protein [Clostridia bacterium]